MVLLPKRWMSDKGVEKKYVRVGAWIGDAVSYSCLGEPIGMEGRVKKWGTWEQEYARRGYRTISLDRFIKFGGYGISLDDVLRIKRDKGEEPIFHAQIYQKGFLGKIEPSLDLKGIMEEGQIQRGHYEIPSTE